MAAKKKIVKKVSRKKATAKTASKNKSPSKKKTSHQKKTSTRAKTIAKKIPAKKKGVAKRTTKTTSVKKKKLAKKPSKPVNKKPSKKAPAKVKVVKKVTNTKKTAIKKAANTSRSSPEELREITKTLNEIRALELDNKKLENQIAKAQTKQEILSELKTYLALLKQAPSPTPAMPEDYKKANPHLVELQQQLEQNKDKLEQETEQTQTKDKLITRLKNLLATKTKGADNEQTITQEPKEIEYHQEESSSNNLPRPPTPPPVEQQEAPRDNNEPVQVDITQSATENKPLAAPAQSQQKSEEKLEAKPSFKESDFKTNKTKGIITLEEAQEYSDLLKAATAEINRVFLGQEVTVEQILLSVVCDAHSLLEGVPGLAKTLLIETLAKIIDGTTFKRIQFLPDLLPSDIIGGQIFNPKTAEYKIYKGPIFANFVLCDEINRAPPKTHAAVMEAMQEKKINIENEEFILDRPFFVLATQNPLENKGTYDLPEAVLDRFMFKVMLDYPRREIEYSIITENATTKNVKRGVRKVFDKEKLLEMQQKIRTVYIGDKIRNYILDLVEATRGVNKDIQGFKYVKYGAGVRASIYLSLAAKAKAVAEGRNYVLPDDIDFVAPAILRHRIALNYRGKAHNITPDKIADEILSKVKAI